MNETGLITFICEQYGISFYLKGERTFLEKVLTPYFLGVQEFRGEKWNCQLFAIHILSSKILIHGELKSLKILHVQEAVTHFILFKLGYYFLDIQYIATKPKLLGFDTF